MQQFLSRTSIVAICIALSACGGGGGDDSGSVTTPAVPGTNGLDYGNAGQRLSDAEGITITGDAAQLQDGTVAQSPGTITLDAGFFSGARHGTVTIFGEQVTITDGAGTLPSTGQDVNLFFDSSRSGTYAATLQVATYGASQPDAIDGEIGYVFGFETNPAEINAVTGALEYTGEFLAGGLLNGTTEAEYEGAVTFIADFDDNDVTGRLVGQIDSATSVNLDLSNGALAGNGFTGGLTCDAGCNGSAGNVVGTFYGPSAAELGGTLALDFENFVGAGTFILTDPTQPTPP